MSFFCSIEKSTTGTSVHKVAQHFLAPLRSTDTCWSQSRHVRRSLCRRLRDQLEIKSPDLQSWFVNALVAAGQCRMHGTQRSATSIYGSQCRAGQSKLARSNPTFLARRYQHTKVSESKFPEPTTKEELLSLVDQYYSESPTDQLPVLELPNSYHHTEGTIDGSKSWVSDLPVDAEWPSKAYTWPAQGENRKAVERLKHKLKDEDADPEELFQLYKTLPSPRIPYLEANHRHTLLYRLGAVEHKNEHAMLRYLSIVDDMKGNEIPLRITEWNMATSFLGSYVSRVTEVEVEAGLRQWREMEHVAGVKANAATFNILFDMATKAGKFKLGEMIYEEMENRNLKFTRFHHVSLIYYHGLARNGPGIRKAYKDLVEAGEIVDTVVLNCMISSLIKAREPQAAEQVYERMKKMHSDKMGTAFAPRDWKSRREVTNALIAMANLGKTNPETLESSRNEAIIAPDLQTYRILIQYLAVDAGDLQRASKLLDEMKTFKVQLHGAIFLSLFKGFFVHGGIRYSEWKKDRLESVWKAYIQALDQSTNDDVYLGKWIIIWALRAYMKVVGPERMLEIWDEVKSKWKPQQDDLDHVTKTLRELTQN